jgi:AhpD family alkylhydroperoxidase
MTTTETVPVRLDFDHHAPHFSRAMAHLDRAATKELDRVELDPRLRELVRVRASQLNGCAYCIDMHSTDEVAALVALVVTINAWNAIGVSTRAWVPGSYQP